MTVAEWEATKLSKDPEMAALQRRFLVTMGTKVLYGPQPRQARAHAVTQPNLLYGGAMAGGKSHWIRWHLILAAASIPNFRALLLRRTYKELETSQLLSVTLEVPAALAKWSSADKQLKFENGSVIQFGHCNTDADFAQWLSSEWEIIAIDEGGTFTPWQLTMLRTRLRTNKPDVRPQFVIGSNPGGVGHIWLKARFIDKVVPPEEDQTYDTAKYFFVPAKVDDNEYINPEYKQFLDSLPEDERRAYRDGDWDVFAGQYFRQLRRDIHGFDFPLEMPPRWRSWPKFRSFDWGFAKPASMGWWAVDPEGHPYRYRELYVAGLEVEDFMAMVLEMSLPDFPGDGDPELETALSEGWPSDYEYTVADPSCWDSSHGPSKAERAMLSGVPMVPAERKSLGDRGVRVEGWSLMRRYVDPKSIPLLRVAHQCANWWRTVPTLVHDDKRVEDLDSDGEDHAADETRYFLTSRPMPKFLAGQGSAKRNPFPPGSPSWHAHDRLQRDLSTKARVKRPNAADVGEPEDPIFGGIY